LLASDTLFFALLLTLLLPCCCALLLLLLLLLPPGVVLKDLKRLSEAEACFEAVVRLRPSCALAHGNLAGG
jgi:hypothetical protein